MCCDVELPIAVAWTVRDMPVYHATPVIEEIMTFPIEAFPAASITGNYMGKVEYHDFLVEQRNHR